MESNRNGSAEAKGTVGVDRARHHGRRVRAQPRRRRLARARLRHRRRRAGARSRAPASRSPPTPRCRARGARPSSPACRARGALDATAARHRRRQTAAPRRDRGIDLHDRGQDQAERTLRKAGHVLLDCPVSGTGAQAKNKDLVVYASGDAAEIKRAAAVLRGVRPRGARPRRIRQRQPDEIRRQPAGRDPQRRERRSHGARHEGRAAAAADLRPDQGRRRQFARVRAARADDGEGPTTRRRP